MTRVIKTIKTCDVRTAAALMAAGFPLQQAQRSADKPVLLQFVVLVGDDKEDEARDIASACQAGYDLTVHLGRYERAYASLRSIIQQFKDGDGQWHKSHATKSQSEVSKVF